MKRILIYFAILFTSNTVSADSGETQFSLDAKLAIQELALSLKSSLSTAMKNGGPLEAISVCKEIAPQVATQLSDKYALDISRTSLKVRNPANQADEWETSVLLEFEQKIKSGVPAKELAKIEQIDGQGWRMMKAIPTGQLCLTCHGTDIEPDLQVKLNQLYPEDKAVGFDLGDLRGAFTVSRP